MALLRDLRAHDVRVVAVGGHDHGVGLLDSRRLQRERVEGVSLDGAARESVAQALERLGALVDHGHVPAGRRRAAARPPTNAPAADDDRVLPRPYRYIQHE